MATIKVIFTTTSHPKLIENLTDPTVVNDGTAYTVFDTEQGASGPPSKFVATFPLKLVKSIERQD